MKLARVLAPPVERAALREWQLRLAARVRLEPGPLHPTLVAAADVAYARHGEYAFAAAVVVEAATWETVDAAAWSGPIGRPYESGLFGAREALCLWPVLEELSVQPHALLVDGHGIAHPRRFGLACHVGLMFDIPVVGCAKQPLCGTVARPDDRHGAVGPVVLEGYRVGAALRTRAGVKPIYVSPGHRYDVDSAVAMVRELAPLHRIPEPLRRAHQRAVGLRAAAGAD